MESNSPEASESAQSLGMADVKRKAQFTGTVLKTTLAGAIVDVGLDTPGVIHISQLQKKPTNRVTDVVQVGQTVDVWVRRVDPQKGRIELTMLKPFDLEWREISKGMVVKGKVTRLEKFGAFVEIGAERPGLVHISELTQGYIKTPSEVVNEGDDVEVQVLEVNRRKRQIKLSMKSLEEKRVQSPKPARQKRTIDTKKEPAKVEPVPTAMEMALREAMERSKGQEGEDNIENKRQPAGDNKDEMGEILSRTLQQKVRTGK